MESYIPPFYSPLGNHTNHVSNPTFTWGRIRWWICMESYIPPLILFVLKPTNHASNPAFTWGRIKWWICMKSYITPFHSPSRKIYKSRKQPKFYLGENETVDMHEILYSTVLFSLLESMQITQATHFLLGEN